MDQAICKQCGKPFTPTNGRNVYCSSECRKSFSSGIIERKRGLTSSKLYREWDTKKNGGIDPHEVFPKSGKKIWWKCPRCGYSWQSTVANRANGRGCPVCANRIVVSGINDLATTDPNVAAEWDYSRNGESKPSDFTHGSGKIVWFICSKCGFHWRSKILNRTQGSGCPACAHYVATPGVNDLSTTNPDITKEWDYMANEGLLPEQFTHGSDRTVWWKCNNGHQFSARIRSRSNGYKCPYCS